MFTIAFLIPYPEMEEILRTTWDEHNYAMSILNPDYSPEYKLIFEVGTLPSTAKKLLKHADVLAVRGGSASMIKQSFPSQYFIEIPISGSDLMSVVRKAVSECGDQPIAMIGTFNMLYSVDKLVQPMGMNIKSYFVDDVEIDTLEDTIDIAMQEGRQIILGGVNTVLAANQKGLHGYVIESSRESVWMALTEAKRLCNIIKNERERAHLYQAVMNSSKEGMLAVNLDGELIAINSSASELLDIGSELTQDQPLDTLIEDTSLAALLCDSTSLNDEIVKYNEKQLSLNKTKVRLHDKDIGYVTTLQDATRIIEAESKLRNKMFTRRHIARLNFHDVIGESQVMQSAVTIAKRCSKTNSNVLILGESGTGKEVFAQSIHNYSNRLNKPFVAVNCAALPENLLESELFGYAEGAFTGASKGGKPGMFELAHGGTIFLDEISEIPHQLQGRLLRVIQEKEVMRIGHDRLIPVDVRIICATNMDLFSQVEKDLFREDLYYRLNVLTIRLPSIRERREDIIMLAEYFLKQYAKENNRPVPRLDQSAKTLLTNFQWGGNIRELRNICERLSVFDETGVISKENVLSVLDHAPIASNLSDGKLVSAVSDQERESIINALAQTKGNKLQAAELLGISRSTLWRKINEHNI